MEAVRTRYPGAQPFSDDTLSRAIFFGRENETSALTDQIIANRLVVVYAKSGLGKTSLLQAGVCQPLRDDGYLPLVVRVNDIKRGPMLSVVSGVQAAAQHQQIEYRPGSEHSLWHFFKTSEFWRGDLLLIPVLILDQFEELFTLHTPDVRAAFLRQLGYLVRGIRPEISEPIALGLSAGGDTAEQALTDTPPEIRIVISLREDYVGSLEEAADDIPQILNHRFRLTPLTSESAATAVVGPTKVRDDRLVTKPFTYHPATVQSLLEYLSRRTKAGVRSPIKYVEPFHLQLICQKVEAIVANRQRQAGEPLEIKLTDLGGEKGLKTTLRDFYKGVLRSVEPRRTRRRVRRLCEQYLISPEGRRLSLEQSEIDRILSLPPRTLRWLVDRRLLRSDQRADSWYYELSHDSLVEPILATRRMQGLSVGLFGLLGSILAASAGLGIALIFPIVGTIGFMEKGTPPRDATETLVGLVGLSAFFLCLGVVVVWASVKGFRRSTETLNRYIRTPA
jgi:hypothetical protein